MKNPRKAPAARRGGLLIKLMLVLALVFVLAAAAWVVLLPGIVTSMVRARTGFTVKIEKLSVNPFTANVRLSGLVLENPAGWPETGFVQLREFHAKAELFSAFSDRWVADEVMVDVAHVTLVRNKDGVLNAAAFMNGFTGEKPEAAPAAKSSGSGPQKKFLIKRLVLKFDQLTYADYSGRRPNLKTYALNINRELTEVDSVAKLLSPFSGSPLAILSNAAGGTLKLDPDQLMEAVKGLEGLGKKAGETLKNLFHSLEKKKP